MVVKRKSSSIDIWAASKMSVQSLKTSDLETRVYMVSFQADESGKMIIM